MFANFKQIGGRIQAGLADMENSFVNNNGNSNSPGSPQRQANQQLAMPSSPPSQGQSQQPVMGSPTRSSSSNKNLAADALSDLRRNLSRNKASSATKQDLNSAEALEINETLMQQEYTYTNYPPCPYPPVQTKVTNSHDSPKTSTDDHIEYTNYPPVPYPPVKEERYLEEHHKEDGKDKYNTKVSLFDKPLPKSLPEQEQEQEGSEKENEVVEEEEEKQSEEQIKISENVENEKDYSKDKGDVEEEEEEEEEVQQHDNNDEQQEKPNEQESENAQASDDKPLPVPTRQESTESSNTDYTSEISALKETLKMLNERNNSIEKTISEFVPISSLDDLDSLHDQLKNLVDRVQMSTAEVKRLTLVQEEQKERVQEMRESHRLEVSSQSNEIHQLKEKVNNLETSLANSLEEAEKAKALSREDEDKRAKSISLLKAVRQKLVKAEKDKEIVEKELESARETESELKNKLEAETNAMRSQNENKLNKLRSGYEKDITTIRADYERELTLRKNQAEKDAQSRKSAFKEELESKDNRIQALESTLDTIRTERDGLFDEGQVRQSELEEAQVKQAHLEARVNELMIEARESNERAATLSHQLEQEQSRQRSSQTFPGHPVKPSEQDQKERQNDADGSSNRNNNKDGEEEKFKLKLLSIEKKHQEQVSALNSKIETLENEKNSALDIMSAKTEERVNELQRLRQQISEKEVEYKDTLESREKVENQARESSQKISQLQLQVQNLESLVQQTKAESEKTKTQLANSKEQSDQNVSKIEDLEAKLKAAKALEDQLRQTIKNLREDVRKLQSGLLLHDRTRSPGVGYFSGKDMQREVSSGGSSEHEQTTATSSTGTTDVTKTNDEALNYEYLRNVILQFLEHKEMRPHLVNVLGVILRFTPSEKRRLAAKV